MGRLDRSDTTASQKTGACPLMGRNVINVHIIPSTHAELGVSKTFYQHYTGYDEIYGHSKVNMKNILDAVITALWAHNERKKINATFLECGRPLVTWQSDVYGHSREFASLMAQMGFDGHFISPISYDDELSRMKSKSLEFVWRGSDDLGASTDIFTHKLFDGFAAPPGFCFGGLCDDPLIITSDTTFSNVEERVKEFLSQIHQRQSPYYTTKNVMVVMGARYAYHDAPIWFANIDKLIANVNSKQASKSGKVYLFYSTPACYLKAVHEAIIPRHATRRLSRCFSSLRAQRALCRDSRALSSIRGVGSDGARDTVGTLDSPACSCAGVGFESRADAIITQNLTTKQDDFIPQTSDKDTHATGMYTSRPVIKYLAREVHLYIQIAKQLQVLAQLGNNDKKFEEIMWISGVLQDHSVITGGMRRYVTEYYARKAYLAKEICMQMYRPAFKLLVQARRPTRTNPSVRRLAFRARLKEPIDHHRRGPIKDVQPGLRGVEQNHSIISIPDIVASLPDRGEFRTEDELVFIAEKIPPLGYKSYFIDRIHIRTRTKRSVLKRIFQKDSNNTKKYYTRQTNFDKTDDKDMLDDIPEYEYFEDVTEKGHDKVPLAYAPREFYTDDFATKPPMTKNDIANKIRNDLRRTTTSLPSTTTSTLSTSTTETVTKSTTSPTTSQSTTFRTTTEAPTQPLTSTMKFEPYNLSSTTPDIIEYYDEETTPNLEENTTPAFDFENFYRRMENSGYYSVLSSDKFIENEYITINVNQDNKLLNILLSNGVNVTFDIQFCYYVSDDPEKLGTTKKRPGAFIFRPMDSQPILVSDIYDVKILKTDIVEEIQIRYAEYAGISLKLYKGLPTIEADWVVGPIPIADELGKEIFVRYVTDLNNDGVFYTDSNGRQTMKRIRDKRPTYTPTIADSTSAVAPYKCPLLSKGLFSHGEG
ncbi:unnamed protein product [Spodoptera exigua]|nr:unnamed protein product [Spodoptera exigua]